MTKYKAPEFDDSAFNCPHCNAYSRQVWHKLSTTTSLKLNPKLDTSVALCEHCEEFSIWHDGEMISPILITTPSPNSDLNKEIKSDYLEASRIANKSPRGATALLRLCIQKICRQLGEKGDNINEDIKSLVKKGLPVTIQQALDTVRVIGNSAVHPGQIDIKDNKAIANSIFGLINMIAQVMITQPKEIEAMYNSLPESQLKAIAKRDSDKPKK